MLIRVLMEDGEEGLFNADCLVAHLLHAIKRKLQIPKSEDIDLCTAEGELKQLYCHKDDSAAQFFTLRELCLVVSVQVKASDQCCQNRQSWIKLCLINSLCAAQDFRSRDVGSPDKDSPEQHFTPILSEYATNENFVSLLNSTCGVHVKLRHPPSSAKSPVLPDSTKAKLGAGRGKKRRNSAYKT